MSGDDTKFVPCRMSGDDPKFVTCLMSGDDSNVPHTHTHGRKKIDKAFSPPKLASVLVRLNSPGGSAVQVEWADTISQTREESRLAYVTL